MSDSDNDQLPPMEAEANKKTNQIICDYHFSGVQKCDVVSRLLQVEHKITMSEATVARQHKELGLKGSKATTEELSQTTKQQLVLDQLGEDPACNKGPALIKRAIFNKTGINLTEASIANEMRLEDPDGFEMREPHAKKVTRQALVSVGIHEEWSGDRHDKLSKIGFPVYGICEKWSGKWLGLWVVLNNRLKSTIAYLYLTLIEEEGGMPIQTTTDCGSETTEVYGLANALRDAFSPHLPIDEIPAHRFLKSIHNTTIERGWLHLRLEWGENVKIFWDEGQEVYNDSDSCQYELVQWLWPKIIQDELDRLKDTFNNSPVRFDKNKILPSGVSPRVAYALHEDYGAINCLQSVNMDVIRELKEYIGDEDLLHFVSKDFASHCEEIYASLGNPELNLQNAWRLFSDMLPLVFPEENYN